MQHRTGLQSSASPQASNQPQHLLRKAPRKTEGPRILRRAAPMFLDSGQPNPSHRQHLLLEANAFPQLSGWPWQQRLRLADLLTPAGLHVYFGAGK